MQYQDTPGFYLYGIIQQPADYHSNYKLTCICSYESINQFIQISVWKEDCIRGYFASSPYDMQNGQYLKVLADENGNIIHPDVLIHHYRQYRRTPSVWRWPPRRKRAYGGYRHIKTTQERRMIQAFDDEPDAPRPRTKRTGNYLPDCWDDYLRHCEKSWKFQSKRKRQWKAK